MPQHKGVLSKRWRPDLIVGVDFGMTCTGVVYARLPSNDDIVEKLPDITQIKRWPGAYDQVLEKVPSELIYASDNRTVQSWGAECKGSSEGWHRCKRWFKLQIPDQAAELPVHDDGESTTTLNDHLDGESARRYFEDYLTKLCAYVDRKLQDQVSDYKSLKVEYAFTVPTSWYLNVATFDKIKRILQKAVGVNDSRQARIGLTEAAAAGSDSGKDLNKKGDVVLVVDTGGGTTDVNIYRCLSSEKEAARIKSLTRAEGDKIGSTRIDQSCLDYLTARIHEVCGRDSSNWLRYGDKAVREKFNSIKYSYGESAPPTRGYELLPIGPSGQRQTAGLGVAPSSDFEPPTGEDGSYHFKIPNREMRSWFDGQISEIISLIKKQLDQLQQEHRFEKVTRVVLSGGFALNQYYRSELRKFFKELRRSKDSRVDSDFEILNAREPHLAVVQGLVYNRMREVMGMGSTYEYVVSPRSFGFVMSEKYRWLKHHNLGEVPHPSPLDGKQYIRGQIDWIIEEGKSVPSKGMKKGYDIFLHSEVDTLPQTFQIVSCDNPRRYLPKNISQNAVKPVCDIKIDVSKLAVEKRKRKLLSRESDIDETRLASFDLWVMIGAADLRFEVKPRGEGDMLASLEHDEIDVSWASSEDKENRKTGALEEGAAAKREVIVKKSSR